MEIEVYDNGGGVGPDPFGAQSSSETDLWPDEDFLYWLGKEAIVQLTFV